MDSTKYPTVRAGLLPRRFCSHCQKLRVCYRDSGQPLCMRCSKTAGTTTEKHAWMGNIGDSQRSGNAQRKAAYFERRLRYDETNAITPRYY